MFWFKKPMCSEARSARLGLLLTCPLDQGAQQKGRAAKAALGGWEHKGSPEVEKVGKSRPQPRGFDGLGTRFACHQFEASWIVLWCCLILLSRVIERVLRLVGYSPNSFFQDCLLGIHYFGGWLNLFNLFLRNCWMHFDSGFWRWCCNRDPLHHVLWCCFVVVKGLG